jgi:hypothetical protein
MDLIQLWEDHTFLSDLISEFRHQNQGSPTLKFDPIYSDIFSQHPELSFLLRARLLCSESFRLWSLLCLCDRTLDIFRPFLSFRQIIHFPLPRGDSPLDCLGDPLRARTLYFERQDTAEELVLLWIRRAKEVIQGTSDYKIDR